jgi:curved DNA-binding protein CbpA
MLRIQFPFRRRIQQRQLQGNMNNRSHYETLGVPKDASLNDIKKAFRVLSMQTHPDVAKDKTQAERFKQIAEAYRVLSNTTERGLYDLEVSSRYFGNNSTGGRSGFGGGMHGAPKPPRSQHHDGVHGVLERIFRPRVVFLSLTLGVATMWIARSYYQHDPERERLRRDKGGSPMVEAWKNPATGQWELPAPWDPAYRNLKQPPKLKLVPRDQVKHSMYQPTTGR